MTGYVDHECLPFGDAVERPSGAEIPSFRALGFTTGTRPLLGVRCGFLRRPYLPGAVSPGIRSRIDLVIEAMHTAFSNRPLDLSIIW